MKMFTREDVNTIMLFCILVLCTFVAPAMLGASQLKVITAVEAQCPSDCVVDECEIVEV